MQESDLHFLVAFQHLVVLAMHLNLLFLLDEENILDIPAYLRYSSSVPLVLGLLCKCSQPLNTTLKDTGKYGF